MQLQRVILGAIVALAMAAPAQAQQSSDPSVGPPFALQNYNAYGGYVPSLPVPKATSNQLAAEADAENPGVTSAAKSTYDHLAAGDLDRAKLTDDVSKALPATLVRSASPKLAALGTPSWAFVGNAQSSAGDVSIYKLQYAKGVAYMTFGVSNAGVIYALYLGAKPTPPLSS